MRAKWPGYLLVALIFLIPLAAFPTAFDQYGTPKLALFIILCGFLCGAVLCAPGRLRQLPVSVLLMLGFFLMVQFGQMLRLPAPWGGFLGEYGQSESFLVQAGFILIFLGGFLFLDNEAVLIFMRRIAVLVLIFTSVYGLYEYFWGDPITHAAVNRVKSVLGDPNSLGVFLVLTLPLLFWELYVSDSKLFQALSCAAIFLSSANLLLTFSRAAWLGFLVCLLFFLITTFRFLKKQPLILFLLLLMLFSGFAAGEFSTRFHFKSHSDYDFPARINSVARGNDSGRRLLWPIAWHIFKTSPVWGYGLGTFQDLFHRYQNLAAIHHWGPERDLREAHNEILQYLATQGLGGFLSYFGLLLTFCLTLWPRPSRGQPSLALFSLTAAVCGYLIFMQFAYPLVHYSCLFWLYWGIMIRFQIPEPPVPVTTYPPNRYYAILMGTLFCSALWLGYRVYQADVYYQKAFNLGHAHQYQRSLTYFPKLIGLNPWMYQYRYRQALTYIRAARRSDLTYRSSISRKYLYQARTILDQLALAFPDRYQISYFRGKIAEYLCHDATASRYYREALRLFPANYKIWFRLALAEMRRGRHTAALVAWHAGEKINRPYMKGRLKCEHLSFIFFQ